MEITYNTITLEITKTNSYAQEAVHSADGTDYLYTKHTLDVQAIFNPKATAYLPNANGKPDSAPVATPGTLPALTARAIRFALMQPRKVLVVKVSSDVLLNEPAPLSKASRFDTTISPELRYATDAMNGPIPISCTVTQVSGKKLFIVQYRIEAYINECQTSGDTFNENSDNPLLSNRWQSSLTVDDQFFSIKVVEGRAKFRTDWMLRMNPQIADKLREKFIHPVDPRFKREQIKVVASPDGSEIVYALVDREMPYSFGRFAPTTKIEAFHSISSNQPGPAEKDKGAAPFLTASVSVKAWGRAGSLNWDLIVKAIFIANSKFPNGRVYHFAIREALHVPYIELDATAFLAPGNAAPQDFAPINLTKLKDEASNDPVPLILTRDEVNNPRPGDAATGVDSPSGEPYSRGWAALKLVTAFLKNNCVEIVPPFTNCESPPYTPPPPPPPPEE